MVTRSLLLVSFLVVGCGGIADTLPDGGSGNDGGGTPDSAPPGPDCPVSAPAESAACSKEGIECEYGDDIRSSCNQIVTCDHGKWAYSFGGDPTCPTGPNASACPQTFEQAQSAGSCNALGTSCNYSTSSATRFCSCINFGGPILEDGGGQGSWGCSVLTQSCPAARPRIGQTCSQLGTDCSYDSCGVPGGLSFECSADTGTWVVGPGELCAGAN